MKLVYVAGRYRDSRGPWYIERNIEDARRVSRELWAMGCAVICPHSNTALMDGADIPDSRFLDGDLVMLAKCDAVVMLPGWELSAGATAEKALAEQRGIPVFEWLYHGSAINEFANG